MDSVWRKPESPHPQYRVRWIANRGCKACGHCHKEQYTFAFFKPEAALEHATYVLSKGTRFSLSINRGRIGNYVSPLPAIFKQRNSP